MIQHDLICHPRSCLLFELVMLTLLCEWRSLEDFLHLGGGIPLQRLSVKGKGLRRSKNINFAVSRAPGRADLLKLCLKGLHQVLWT